jgi:outer membrane biosynthesis protein TonB
MPTEKAKPKAKPKEKPKEKERPKKKKSDQRAKRKTSERKTSVKKTWERFVQQSDSRSLLKDIWKAENFQKEYIDKINKLHKKYSN